jgi:hypothetical protein
LVFLAMAAEGPGPADFAFAATGVALAVFVFVFVSFVAVSFVVFVAFVAVAVDFVAVDLIAAAVVGFVFAAAATVGAGVVLAARVGASGAATGLPLAATVGAGATGRGRLAATAGPQMGTCELGFAVSRLGIWTTTGSAADEAPGAAIGAAGGGVTGVGGDGGACSGALRAGVGSGSWAATSRSLPRVRERSTITVVTMPHAKVIRQIPVRLVFDRTISRLATVGEARGVTPPARTLEIRSVPYPAIARGAASSLICGAGVGVAPVPPILD